MSFLVQSQSQNELNKAIMFEKSIPKYVMCDERMNFEDVYPL